MIVAKPNRSRPKAAAWVSLLVLAVLGLAAAAPVRAVENHRNSNKQARKHAAAEASAPVWHDRLLGTAMWTLSTAWGVHLPWWHAPTPSVNALASGRPAPLRVVVMRVVRRQVARQKQVVESQAPAPRSVRPGSAMIRRQPQLGHQGLLRIAGNARRWPDEPARMALDQPGLVPGPNVKCQACVASAASAESGEDSIYSAIDIKALTTVEVGNSVLRLTNLRPISLLFRKQF